MFVVPPLGGICPQEFRLKPGLQTHVLKQSTFLKITALKGQPTRLLAAGNNLHPKISAISHEFTKTCDKICLADVYICVVSEISSECYDESSSQFNRANG